MFWTGHGLITPQGDRRLIYADATLDDLKNLNLNAQLNAMQTEAYKNLPQQLLIFDACANSQQFDFILGNETPQIPYVRLPDRKQMVMFAANPGEYAINKGDEQTGLFTRELMKELKSLNETEFWLPDMEAVMRNIQQKFIKLREDGETQQTPAFFLYQDWTGNKTILFEEPETSAPTRSEKSREELLKEVSPEEIRKALVRAFPTKNRLERMFNEGIGAELETRLNFEIPISGDLNEIVYNLWQWAEDNESEIELLQSAYRANSKRSELRSLAEYLGIAD